jgi:hypothetical protein
MKLLLLALLVAAIACASFAVRHEDSRPTLLILNKGMENLRVSDEYGRTLARIFAGDRACITLDRDARQQLFFEQPYKRVAGPAFNPFARAGWKVEIANMLMQDVLSLVPAERCR